MFLETKDPRAAKRTEASPTKESVSKRRRFGLDGSRRGRKHTQTRVAPFRPCLPPAGRCTHTPFQQQGDSGFSKRCSTSIVRSKQLAGLQTSKFAILLQVLDTGMNSSVNSSNHPEHAPRAGRLKCSVELDA